MKKNHRLPTIIGLLLLLIGVSAGVFLINRSSGWLLKASPEITPKQVKITNINDSSFSVSWITDAQTEGYVQYGIEKNVPYLAKDDRDQASSATGNFSTHHVTIKNLQASTNYYFKVVSGGKPFDNNGQLYQLTIAPKRSDTIPANDVAYGTVLDQNGSPVEGAIVYLSIANATPQSTITKSSGSWVIPLNLALSQDLNAYASYDRSASLVEIFVQAGTLGSATAVGTTKGDSPLPNLTLGNNSDFRQNQPEITDQEIQTATSSAESTPSSHLSLESLGQEAQASGPAEITIINPDKGEKVNTDQPEIIGTGPAGKTITIKLESDPVYQDQVLVDESGNWSWTPPAGITPGDHKVTVTYVNDKGATITATHFFTVLAAGESDLPALVASPSATLTTSPTPTPTSRPTPTPTRSATVSATPTPRPSLTLTPTPTPKVTPTTVSSPTPTQLATESGRTSMPSTESGVPSSGFVLPTFMASILGFIFFGAGLTSILFRNRVK